MILVRHASILRICEYDFGFNFFNMMYVNNGARFVLSSYLCHVLHKKM